MMNQFNILISRFLDELIFLIAAEKEYFNHQT